MGQSENANTEEGTYKPNARRIGWTPARTATPFVDKRLTVHQDEVEIPDKGTRQYTYVETPPGVDIVPVTADGDIILISQYRYAPDEELLELPAGSLGDQEGKPLDEVVRLELRQEIGAACGEVQEIGDYFESPAHMTQWTRAVIAWDTRIEREPEREPGERIEVRRMPAAEAFRRARADEVRSGTCALALFLAEQHLQERGLLR